MKNYLDFEKEIKALEQVVEGLKSPFGSEKFLKLTPIKLEHPTRNKQKIKEFILI